VRYYEYLSTSKVEMLHPQLVLGRSPATSEIGVDLKLVKVNRKKDGAGELPLHDRLSAVEEWIYANEPVGTVDDPDVWIYGRTELLAATLTLGADVTPGPVLYTPAEGPELLMGGSVHNTSGRRPYPGAELPSTVRYFSSRVELGAILSQFAADLGLPDRGAPDSEREDGEWDVYTGLTALLRDDHSRIPNWLAHHVASEPADVMSAKPVSLGECEFLAKRLRTTAGHTDPPRPATLATPLYVAITD
jgi:hypothetical protein